MYSRFRYAVLSAHLSDVLYRFLRPMIRLSSGKTSYVMTVLRRPPVLNLSRFYEISVLGTLSANSLDG